VAADDGPRAQTFEHLELLDALGLKRAIIAVTKSDVVEPGRVAEVTAALRSIVDRTDMTGAPIVAVSGVTGEGVASLRERLIELRDALLAEASARPAGPLRLPIDRAFAVRGRGAVVTGTLRGGAVTAGLALRLVPYGARGEREVRVREVQVHHGRAEQADGGRTALNLAAIDSGELSRGQVLTAGPGIEATDRLLVELRAHATPGLRAGLRLHLWTESVDASVGPTGASWVEIGDGVVAGLLRLARPIAALVGARAVLRDPGSGRVVAGATVLDLHPPRGISRRRLTTERLAGLATAVDAWASGRGSAGVVTAAVTDLHGARDGTLAPDVREALAGIAVKRAADGVASAGLRAELLRELRRHATIERGATAVAGGAIDRLVAELVTAGQLARDGDRVVDPSHRGEAADALEAAMARLIAALDVNVPPSLAEAARDAGCPPEGLRALEASGRIVRVEDDLAWSAARYATLRDLAVEMAQPGPLAPAALRDAVGGNRRVALALLEDLGRRGILRRTDAGHVLGPRAPR
jgi:selenocysteine-specific elongation factor